MNKSKTYFDAMRAYDSDRMHEAVQLMEHSAKDGDAYACFTLALWYKNGEAGFTSLEMSEKWLNRYKELADLGDADIQWDVGQNYRFGNLLPYDIERANYWLQRAVEGGSGEAAHHLGWFYETGQYGYPLDLSAASKFYQLAFERENPETLYLFALKLFDNGKPTEQAIELLARAAAKGFEQAQNALEAQLH